MDFVEEKTPGGHLIKIMFKNWQFLAFDKKGNSVYVDNDGKSLVHHVPLIIFVGVHFKVKKDYTKDYYMLKIRKEAIIVPYKDLLDNKNKYIFLDTDKNLDIIPGRIMIVDSISAMVKDIDIKLRPDYVIIDDTITDNDVIIIKNRYKAENVIRVQRVESSSEIDIAGMEEEKTVNLNMMSTNPVFLARVHLRSMDLSKVNQLLLDFDLTALDTEYIFSFIQNLLLDEESSAVKKNRPMLIDLRNSFKFNLHLLQRNDEEIRKMIESLDSIKKLAPYRTLISKVKSIYPGREEQIQYAEYEGIVIEKRNDLIARAAQSKQAVKNGGPARG